MGRQRRDLDVIRFHVWNDSFETYLEARSLVELAGFNASWVGHETDRKFGIPLRFGPRDPEVRARTVD